MGIATRLFAAPVLAMLALVATAAAPAFAQISAPPDTRPRIALIFGNADYDGDGTLTTPKDVSDQKQMPRDLQKPLNDANDVKQALAALHFQPFVHTDRTRAEMLADLERFSREIQRAGPDALVIIYYSGHAIQVDGVTYLLPTEAVLREPSIEGLASVGLPLSEVLQRLGQPNNGVNFVIIDACRVNPWTAKVNNFVARSRAARATDVVTGEENVRVQSVTRETLQGRGRTVIAWSTDDDEVASDGADSARNSPYTEALLRFLPQKIELGALIGGVAAEVVERTSVNPAFRQSPANYGSAPPGICLAGCVQPLLGPAPAQTSTPFSDCDEDYCPAMIAIKGSPSRLLGATRESDGGYFEQAEDKERYVNIPDFVIGRTEVTADEYAACVAQKGCDPVPAGYAVASGDRPVVGVTWEDTQKYVRWLSSVTRKTYRLPSEAEWEYAARAESDGPFPSGMPARDLCLVANHADAALLDDRGRPANWRNQTCEDGFGREPAPVASFTANKFGLYDMQGNVWEWVQDCYSPRFEEAPDNGAAYDPATCSIGVNRGGGWNSGLGGLRFADRGVQPRSRRLTELGFRVARSK